MRTALRRYSDPGVAQATLSLGVDPSCHAVAPQQPGDLADVAFAPSAA